MILILKTFTNRGSTDETHRSTQKTTGITKKPDQ
jgi:hypothetical protein